jgi:cytochrome c5
MKSTVLCAVGGILLATTAMVCAQDKGQEIYDSKCKVCHGTGAAGAPKMGDKEAWAPRIATGTDSLMNSVINGKNAMPPKGTCMDCSDEDLKAAMNYMISNSK